MSVTKCPARQDFRRLLRQHRLPGTPVNHVKLSHPDRSPQPAAFLFFESSRSVTLLKTA